MNPHLVTPTKSRFEVRLRWGVSLTGAIATCLWLGTPAQGYALDDWQFDPHTQQLTVILPDGVTPNYFLLAEPARIVLNLPNTQLGSVQPAQYYSGPIQSIRVSQFDAESARVVVEFSPNTVLDPRHAELSSHDLAGGTEWTLHPLVVDSPAGTAVAILPNAAIATATSPVPAPSAATAHTAAVGAAVQGPPTYTADDGIRTDASALLGGDPGPTSNQPPGTLPIDPFAAAAPQVSVPPLADSAAPAASALTVPPLADLPDIADSNTAATPAVTVPVPEPPVLAQANLGPEPEQLEGGVPLEVVPSPQPAVSASPLPTLSPATVTPEPSPEPIVTPVVESPSPSGVPAVTTAPPAVSTPAPTTAPPFLAGTTAANTVSANASEPRTIPPPPSGPQPEGTIPFGAPLPDQAKSVTEAGAIAPPPGTASILPVGTLLSLQYPGSIPLVLDREEPWNEVLVLVGDVVDPQTGRLLLSAGTQVLGQFEGFDDSGRRFVVQTVVVSEGNHQPLLAESEWLLGTRDPNVGNIASNSGLGAAAVTILSGFSGIGLLGGAALGAATTYASGPQLVAIQPGQIIVVEVVAEVLPFH